MKVKSLFQLCESIPDEEMIILDVLRNIVKTQLPEYCNEKISYNVPYFYGHKGICIIWPAGIPRGGIKSGVLLGFWQGNLLVDVNNYLARGNNKKIFYKIYKSIEDIDEGPLITLLQEAILLDKSFEKK